MSEVPDEIRAIRERLARLETMAQGNTDFNAGIRRLARKNEVAPDELNQRIRNPQNKFTIEEEETK